MINCQIAKNSRLYLDFLGKLLIFNFNTALKFFVGKDMVAYESFLEFGDRYLLTESGTLGISERPLFRASFCHSTL